MRMGKKALSWLVVFLMLVAMVPMQSFAADDVVVSLAAINVPAPVKGAIPVSTLDETEQYTAAIAWSGSPAAFAGDTEYTATITITPKTGYTLTGVPANFFTVTGAAATNAADTGIVTAVFPKTAPDSTISTAAIDGVTAPVRGATPASIVTETSEYTGTVAWSGSPAVFAGDTEYTATITITPKIGFTLTGVSENFFTVAGATATNTTDSGIITAVFPRTAADSTITIAAIDGVTAPIKGATPASIVTETPEYTGTVAWSSSPTVFAGDTVYTATITLTPKAGFTLTGVPENFFTVAGATSTNTTNAGIITAVFPKTQSIVAPNLTGATTNVTGDTVTLSFDKPMSDPSSDVNSFDLRINGHRYYNSPVSKSVPISSAKLNSDPTKIDLVLVNPLQRGDVITISYSPGNVMAADTDKLLTFSNQSVANTIPVVIDTNLQGTWQEYDHVGNWQELPFPTGNDPRGKEYNRHIVIQGGSVYFYGNGVWPFKDFLYLPSSETAAKSFTFDLDLGGIKYHSMEGGGFLFNTIIDNGLISGYCALFTNNYGYAVSLYQIDGVDVKLFHNGTGQYYNLSANPEGITELGTYPLSSGNLHTITLECSSTTVDMWDGNDKLIEKLALPKKYSNGVGIIGSYQSHDCSELSYFIFSHLNIQGIADLSAILAGDQANLTFTAPEGSTSVKVEQSTDAGVTWAPSTIVSPIGPSSTTATVTGLTKYKTYYFRLDITGGRYAGYSRTATAKYIVGPINDLVATGGDGIANLTFTPPQGASALTVQQSTDGGETWGPATVSSPLNPTSSSATVTGLTNGQRYSFKIVVSAELGGGDSNVANATPMSSQQPPTPPSPPPAAPEVNKVQYKLTIAQEGQGTVLPVLGVHEYNSDSVVILYATPAEGYTFEGWAGTTLTDRVLMDGNKTVTAVFKKIGAEAPIPSEEPATEEPEPSVEPTPTPTPTPEVIIEEETTPEAPTTLPKTGGIPVELVYGLGGLITVAGFYLKRKQK